MVFDPNVRNIKVNDILGFPHQAKLYFWPKLVFSGLLKNVIEMIVNVAIHLKFNTLLDTRTIFVI